MLSFLFFGASCQPKEETTEAIKEWYEQRDREAEYVTVEGVPVARKVRFVQEEDNIVPNNKKIRQIALIRHGEPDLNKVGRFNYEQAKEYIRGYDSVGILVPDEPFFIVEEEEDILFYTSTLNRARTTAEYLFGPESDIVESADFREFERSLGKRTITRGLPLRYWTVTARIEWILGINRDGVESFQEAKERALAGAQKLNQVSEENPKVVLVAHGFLNRYIEKYLRDMGWEVVRDGGKNYFATTILVKVEEEETEGLNAVAGTT